MYQGLDFTVSYFPSVVVAFPLKSILAPSVGFYQDMVGADVFFRSLISPQL